MLLPFSSCGFLTKSSEMGKKQHQKDKLYLTCTEWSTLYGGKRATSEQGKNAEFRRLPFSCCSLSMQPFEHPYSTPDGFLFDLTNILPFLKKFGVNPVTGKKVASKDLIKLNFHKNASDQYHCPVTFKIFNQSSHIVAIIPTGNVFSHEAVQRLNIKPGFWKDLLTDEPFARKDILTIQDPTDLNKFNMSKFFHLKKSLKVVDEEELAARKDSRYHLKSVNLETRNVLDELDREYKAPEKLVDKKERADSINAAPYSMGAVSASFTSTAVDRVTEQEAGIINEDVIRYERIKKKAYVRIATSCGMLNLELHSDMIPKACENFMKHCQNGYYNDTIFHRSIRNFMIQGGDPTGTGKGGESIWGGAFEDHFKPNLTHTGRGILSMANSGPDTNKSQFFITYRSAPHLDRKHTVFGRVVGSIETLDKMEKIEADAKDKPTTDINFIAAQVFVDPYAEVDELLAKEREEAAAKEKEFKEASKKLIRGSSKDTGPKVYREGIGKYINLKAATATKRTIDEDTPEEPKKVKTKAKTQLSDFSAW